MKLRAWLFLFALGLAPPVFSQSQTVTGTACTAGIDVSGKATIGLQVTGSWSGTIQPEVAIQGQAAVNVQVTPSTSSTAQSTITANGIYTATVSGYSTFFLCGNTVTGTATVYFNVTQTSSLGRSAGGGGGGPPTGAAGGDLSGTYPNPTVANIDGTSVPVNSAADQLLVTTASAVGAWKSVGSCSAGTSALTYNTSTHAFGCNTIPGGVTSVSGDGTIISNSSSTGAVTLTLANTVTGTGGVVLAASPTFTGTPAAPTPGSNINTTQIPTTAWVNTWYAPLASPALTGTPTAPTPAATVDSTQIPTTDYVYKRTPADITGNPWVLLKEAPLANQIASNFWVAGNAAIVSSFINPTPKTTVSIKYRVGTTADNTATTYDIGFYTGTPSGTCTLLGHIGPTAGTTFAPTANTTETINWLSSFTLPAGRVYIASTASTPTASLSGSAVPMAIAQAQVTITTGGTLPGTFTCPADGANNGVFGVSLPAVLLN